MSKPPEPNTEEENPLEDYTGDEQESAPEPESKYLQDEENQASVIDLLLAAGHEVLDSGQLAARWGITTSQVSQLRASGQLPKYIKAGVRKAVWLLSDIETCPMEYERKFEVITDELVSILHALSLDDDDGSILNAVVEESKAVLDRFQIQHDSTEA